MSRPLRIEYEGAVYHITARGNERSAIFKDAEDFKKFVSILEDIKRQGSLIIYAYVLMENHYHLLAETPEGNLSKVMHNLQTRYTMYFNKRHSRVGHLFQGRYKAFIVDKDNYLFELSRYIHLNPVRAKIVNDPENYIWSSYGEYIGNREEITDIEFMLDQFSSDRKEGMKRYKEFTEAGRGIKKEDLESSIYGQLIIGTKEFMKNIKRKIDKIKISPEVPKREKIMKNKTVEVILEEVGKYYRITRNELLNKKGRWNEARKISIYIIKRYANKELKEMSKLFGKVHYSAISQTIRRMEERRKKNKALDREIRFIESRL